MFFADSLMTVQTSSCQSCVNAVHQRRHSDKAVQSRACQDVSRRVRLAHVSRVTPLLYRLPPRPARHNHCHHRHESPLHPLPRPRRRLRHTRGPRSRAGQDGHSSGGEVTEVIFLYAICIPFTTLLSSQDHYLWILQPAAVHHGLRQPGL